jgi:hypothetical protein
MIGTAHLLPRAAGFATLSVLAEFVGLAAGWVMGSVLANWYVAFGTGFIGACVAPYIAGLISRKLLGLPRRPLMAVFWIAAGCGAAFAASMLTGQQGQPEQWMGLAFFTSVGAVFASALIFGLVEHRLQ